MNEEDGEMVGKERISRCGFELREEKCRAPAQQRCSCLVTAFSRDIARRLACGVRLEVIRPQKKQLVHKLCAAVRCCDVQWRVFSGARYDVDVGAHVVKPLQVAPVAVILHGHLVQNTPVTRHDVHIVLTHNSHAQFKVTGFGGLGSSAEICGRGGGVLEGAPGYCAFSEELARNTTAAASTGGVVGKRVYF